MAKDADGLGTIYPLANRILAGRLATMLRRWRRQGLSTEQIAVQLRLIHDIAVTGETVRKWCLALGIDPPEEKAS